MRTIFANVVVVLSLAASRALAGDVAYQLENSLLNTIEESSIAEPLTTVFEERAWAVPGIEADANPNRGFCSTGWPISSTQTSVVFKSPDPVWTAQDRLWPKTQSMWGRGEFYRKSEDRKNGPPEIYYFGSIGLQR